jgi:hypothetical protein
MLMLPEGSLGDEAHPPTSNRKAERARAVIQEERSAFGQTSGGLERAGNMVVISARWERPQR